MSKMVDFVKEFFSFSFDFLVSPMYSIHYIHAVLGLLIDHVPQKLDSMCFKRILLS